MEPFNYYHDNYDETIIVLYKTMFKKATNIFVKAFTSIMFLVKKNNDKA